MAHRNMVGGTAYDTSGGRVMVDGTVYGIDKGKTMVDGTVRDIVFSSPVTVTISSAGEDSVVDNLSDIYIDGVEYSQKGTWVFDRIGQITVTNNAVFGGEVHFNGVKVHNPYSFTPSGTIVNINVPVSTIGGIIYITTE